jgi:hypothetical protein
LISAPASTSKAAVSPARGGGSQRRHARLVRHAYVRAAVDQQLRHRQKTADYSEMKWRPAAIHVARVDVGFMVQQQFNQVRAVVHHGIVQRRGGVTGGVDFGVIVQQKHGHIGVVFRYRPKQRRRAERVAFVRIRAQRQQGPRRAQIALSDHPAQRPRLCKQYQNEDSHDYC